MLHGSLHSGIIAGLTFLHPCGIKASRFFLGLVLTSCLTAIAVPTCRGQDITIDHGETYTLNSPDTVTFLHEKIGDAGSGTFIQNGGTNTRTARMGGYLYLGYQSGSSGTYVLNGGRLSGGMEYVGYNGNGSFTQNGGENEGGIYVGTRGGSGSYTLNNGSIYGGVTVGAYPGSRGTGIFTQNGGIVNAGITLGFSEGGMGTYVLNEGTVATPMPDPCEGGCGGGYGSGSSISVGEAGTGLFIQNGGTVSTVNLILGDMGGVYAPDSKASGTYKLAGGSLSAGYERIAGWGDGTFIQSAGINSAGRVTINGKPMGDDTYSEGKGTYILSGGEFSSQYLEIHGELTQTGGVNITGAMTLGHDMRPISWSRPIYYTGLYNLSGGSLTADSITLINAVFTQTGGINWSGAMNVGQGEKYPLSFGRYDLKGGTLVTDSILLNKNGIFNQTGGTLSAVNFTQQGGEVQGSLENRGTFNYTSGTFNGRLLNYGVLNLEADFTAANGLANYSSTPVVIEAGRTVTLSGQGLDNQWAIFVNGALTGNGALLNNTSGFLGGSGTISGNFVNSGMVSAGNSVGTLNITGGFTQTSTGTFGAEIGSATSYDKVNVNGTATLDGKLRAVFTECYFPEANRLLSGVLTATGGITGTFSVNPYLTPTLSLKTLYNPNSVDLIVLRDYITGLDLSGNLQAVGNMLNSIAGVTKGDLNNALNSIDHLGASSAVRDAMQQISSDKSAAFSTLAFAGSALQAHALSNRLNNIRFSDFGVTGAGKRFSLDYSNGGSLTLTTAPTCDSARDADGKLGFDFLGSHSGRSGLYFEPGLARGWQNTTANQTGFDFTMGGFTAVKVVICQTLKISLRQTFA